MKKTPKSDVNRRHFLKSSGKVAAASAVISQLRTEGYSIFLNKRVSSYDGETYMKYRIGTALRSVVAAGTQALRTA